jgi:hypothetical protein
VKSSFFFCSHAWGPNHSKPSQPVRSSHSIRYFQCLLHRRATAMATLTTMVTTRKMWPTMLTSRQLMKTIATRSRRPSRVTPVLSRRTRIQAIPDINQRLLVQRKGASSSRSRWISKLSKPFGFIIAISA